MGQRGHQEQAPLSSQDQAHPLPLEPGIPSHVSEAHLAGKNWKGEDSGL